MEIKYNDGQPCEHNGCLNHISHPCEGCGRIGGRGVVYYDYVIKDIGDIFLHDHNGKNIWQIKKENYLNLNEL